MYANYQCVLFLNFNFGYFSWIVERLKTEQLGVFILHALEIW